MTAEKLAKRTFQITLFVRPQPWRRPRFRNGRGFKDDASIAASAEIRWLVQMKRPPMLEGPLYMRATFYLAKPKSAPKRKLHPDKRPDIDNYIKLLCDSLNSVCYRDDAQIVRMEIAKEYGDPERIELEVGEI